MKKVSNVCKTDSFVMWATLCATVLMPDLDWAIYLGIAISIALYLRATNKVPVKILVPTMAEGLHFTEREIEYIKDPVDILTIQLEGNLYFGSAPDLENKLDTLVNKSKVFILRLKTVTSIDMTALDALKIFIRNAREAGSQIIVCGVQSGLNEMLVNSNIYSDIGAENIFLSEEEMFASSVKALERARTIISCSKENSSLHTACQEENICRQ